MTHGYTNSMTSEIFTKGDTARYTGMASGIGDSFIVSGDIVYVIEGNEDPDDDVTVVLASNPYTATPMFVSASDLVWQEW